MIGQEPAKGVEVEKYATLAEAVDESTEKVNTTAALNQIMVT